MKTRRNASKGSSKPRRSRTRTTNLRQVDEWIDGGAEFLRAVTSGSRVRDDRVIVDDADAFPLNIA